MSYVVPIYRPSGVRHALKLSFLSPSPNTVIVAKSNRLEVYEYGSEGLTHVHTRTVYGYITMLEKLRPQGSQTEHLFVGTDRYQYFTCSWDPVDKQIRTEQSYADQSDKVLRDSREMDKCHVDPSGRFITLELYDGVITVIPIEAAGVNSSKRDTNVGLLGEPLQVRIDERLTRASGYLQNPEDSTDTPKLAILWEDNDDKPQLKVREIKHYATAEPSAEMDTVAELRKELDMGVSHLIPLSTGGFLLLGENSISYASNDLKTYNSLPLNDQSTLWTCWTKVDDARYLLADDYGRLYFIMLDTDFAGHVTTWKLDYLGVASRASCLIYLDQGLVFIGSSSGDSQLVQINPGEIEVMQTFDNIAPIIDFSIMDLGRGAESSSAADFSSGQARIITASGAWQDGTIRSVRSGVGMEDLGIIADLSHITDLWAISSTGDIETQDTLVLNFVDETKILRFSSEGEVEEVAEFHSFNLSEPTLLATNLPDHKALHVSETSLSILDLESSMSLLSWHPSSPTAKITAAASNSVHLLIVESGHTLHVFHTASSTSKPTISKQFTSDSQISSITVPDSQSNICIVSFWQTASIAILDLHSLETLSTQSLGEPGIDIPRSVLVANVLPNSLPTLFIAMADGTVMTYTFTPADNILSNPSRILLGSEAVVFKLLPRSTSEPCLFNVFASCEQPSLIYASEGRIVYSAVSSSKSSRICSFNNPQFEDAVAIATPTELKLASIGQERKTQIQTMNVGHVVRGLAYDAGGKMFGMGCIRREVVDRQEILHSSFKIADEVSFKELDSIDLQEQELVECVITASDLESDDSFGSVFVVGTSIMQNEDGAPDDQDGGRIIVYEVSAEKRIRQIAELGVKGACRSVAMCEGKIVAGLVKAVVLYALLPAKSRGGALEIRKLTSTRISTNPLSISVTPSTSTSPATIAIADLMKSLTIVEVLPPTQSYPELTLKEVARHFSTLWSSACATVGEDEWLVADLEGNLIVLRRNREGVTGDDRKRLAETGNFRLGECVNKIIPIFAPGSEPMSTAAAIGKGKGKERSRTMSSAHRSDIDMSDSTGRVTREGPIIQPKAFMATVEGAIYLYGAINPSYQDVLLRLQTGLANKVMAPGYMPWAKYRAWKTEVKEENEPFRFVDGEMVETGLLKLTDAELEQVLRETGLSCNSADGGMSVTVEEARGWGEELRRLY